MKRVTAEHVNRIVLLMRVYYQNYKCPTLSFNRNSYEAMLKYYSQKAGITGKELHKKVLGNNHKDARTQLNNIHNVFGTTDDDIIVN